MQAALVGAGLRRQGGAVSPPQQQQIFEESEEEEEEVQVAPQIDQFDLMYLKGQFPAATDAVITDVFVRQGAMRLDERLIRLIFQWRKRQRPVLSAIALTRIRRAGNG